MAFELLLRPGSDDQIGYLRRKETSQPTHALDFAHLIGDALFKLLVQLVEIVEQPRVLDGDDGLRSEVLDQIDLLIGERPHLLSVDHDYTEHFVFLEHGHRKHCASTCEPKEGKPLRIVGICRLRLNVGNLDWLSRDCSLMQANSRSSAN